MVDPVHGGSASSLFRGCEAAPAPVRPFARAIDHAAQEGAAALALDDPERAVHDLRKAFKRLRALLRLVHGEGATEARSLRQSLAGAARHLAGARDIAARRDALDDLVAKGHLTPALRKAAARVLAPAGGHQEGLGAHRDELAMLIETCRTVGARFGNAMDASDLVRALGVEYARGRRMGRRVDPADAESLHELRKAVVAQRYQMELVSEAWPALGKVWVGELQRLREKLGRHHDLAVLIGELETLAAEGATKLKWRVPLAEAAQARQQRLVLSSLRLYRRLFAEKPRAFRRRLTVYLKAVSEKE